MNKKLNKNANKAYELAFKYERLYGACSQPTIKALMDVFNEYNHETFRAIGTFAAGGAAECDGTCGAYAAAIYYIGTKSGRNFEDINPDSDPDDPMSAKYHSDQFVMVKQLHNRFIDAYGTIICCQIHRKLYGRPFYISDADELKKVVEAGAHDWGCTSVCGNAAKWTVEILQEFKK